MDLLRGLFLVEGNEGMVLSATTLRRLGERGIKIDLDIYGLPNRVSKKRHSKKARGLRGPFPRLETPDQASWRTTDSVSKISIMSPSRMSS